MKTFRSYFNFNASNMRRLLLIIAGNLLVAFASVFFILPQNILCGGVTTASMVLSSFLPIGRVPMIAILNISLFVLGYLCLGRKFAASSLISTFLYPTLVSLFSMLDVTPFEKVDPVLSAVYAGLLTGAGLGLVFRVNASTGGMDIPALLIHKYAGLPTGQCVMIVDTLTILSGLWIFGLNSILIGLAAVFASSFAINWISTFGGENAQNVMIISDKHKEIQTFLLNTLSRGVTILSAKGAWSEQERPVLMCCVRNREYGQLLREIADIDPHAFVIANSVHEVRGEGFTWNDNPQKNPGLLHHQKKLEGTTQSGTAAELAKASSAKPKA